MKTQRRFGMRGGILFKLLVFIAVVFAFAALAWMLFLPALVTARLRSQTGFDVKVDSLAANPFSGRVAVRGLVINNPPVFPATDFIAMPTFEAEVEAATLFSGDQLIVDRMKLHFAKITLVRRAGGESNAEVFQKNLGGVATAKPAKGSPPPASASTPPRKFLIRNLTLRCDDLVVANYAGAKPVVRDYHLGIDQTYRDVTDAKQLLVPAVMKPLAAANLDLRLDMLVPGDFGKALGNAAKSGTDFLKQAGKKASDTVKGLWEKLEDSRKP
jgi:hypothetical protein